MYRSIGIDASAGSFVQICRTYMDCQLSEELTPASKKCITRRFERWAEKVRLSKLKPTTRIELHGRTALVYDGPQPERVVYVGGEWRLAEAPEIAPVR